MANIATLSVSVTAQTDKFHKGMKKVAAEIGSLASSFVTFGTVAAGAAAAGLTLLVKDSMASIAAIAKLSDRMGITTEALVGFQHAADLSGVSSEELTGALEKMIKQMDPGTDPAEAFRMYADEIVALNDPVLQAQRAMEIFGKSGQRLLPILLGGADGLRQAEAEAAKLGLSFSRLDAAKVEMANDAMTRVGATFKGIGNTLAIELSPLIEAAAKQFVDWATSGMEMGDIVKLALEGVVDVIGKIGDGFSLMKGLWFDFTKALQGWAQSVAEEHLTLELDPETQQTLEHFVRQSKLDMGELKTASDQAWDDWRSGKISNSVRETYDKIKKEAATAAAEIANRAKRKPGAGPAIDFGGPMAFVGMDTNQEGEGFGLKGAVEEAEMLQDIANSLRDSLVTPFQEAEAQINAWTFALEKGFLTEEEVIAGIKKLKMESDEKFKKDISDPGQFRQVSLADTNVEGLKQMGRRRQEVEDPKGLAEDKKANNYLSQILVAVGGGPKAG